MMKYRVLHVYPQLNCGGTEMVIYNLIKFGDTNTFKFELLVQKNGDNEKIFRNLNVPIHVIPFDNEQDYKTELSQFFSDNEFLAVHTHMHFEMPCVLEAARGSGIKHCVSHSHNARIDIPKYLWPLRILRNRRFERYATDLCGCSQLALKWLYPTRWKAGHVIYNGIDLDKFRYSAEMRSQKRAEIGISSATKVFVNVGRCTDQKNQSFILDLAKHKVDENCLFVIIGEGPLYERLKKQKEEAGLKNVWMLGKRSDVNEWLCVADVFLFPSVYEGLGIVAIEAQASGLRVIATDNIPEEADMAMGSFVKLPLKSPEIWLSAMDLPSYTDNQRAKLSQQAFASHYNIRNVTKEVEQIYLK